MHAHTPPYSHEAKQRCLDNEKQAVAHDSSRDEPLLSILADYHAVTRRLEAYIANKRLVAASDLMQDTFRAETLQGFGIGDMPADPSRIATPSELEFLERFRKNTVANLPPEHPLHHVTLIPGDRL